MEELDISKLESYIDYKKRLNLDTLKSGDKLIFMKHSGVLVGDIGDVVTFHSWCEQDSEFYRKIWNGTIYFKTQELYDNSPDHSFCIGSVERFDKEKHKEVRPLTQAIADKSASDFIKKHGE